MTICSICGQVIGPDHRHPMTALTETEQATLDRIEAAPDAEESLRSRVIRATHAAACNCGDEDPTWSTYWQQIADAAIATMRGQA